MKIEQNSLRHQRRFEKDTYTFIQKDGRWYIELFFYNRTVLIKQGFELVEGTDKLFHTTAHGRNKLRLYISVEPLEGSDLLELLECCIPDGGGMYRFKTGRKHNGEIFWICDLALFVFADIPERIYIKRLPLEEQNASDNDPGFS